MREIKFRGKRVDNGEWVYGYYVNQYGAHSIYLPDGADGIFDAYHVIPETVGQFTGLTDKNGTEIFEGDILKYAKDEAYKVVYDDKEAHYAIMGIFGETYNSTLNSRKASYLNVIGNIHEK